jgi:hypothetical protein
VVVVGNRYGRCMCVRVFVDRSFGEKDSSITRRDLLIVLKRVYRGKDLPSSREQPR